MTKKLTPKALNALRTRHEVRKLRYVRDPDADPLTLADVEDITVLLAEFDRVQDELSTMRAVIDRISTTLDIVHKVEQDGA
jgi:hypothetical protein